MASPKLPPNVRNALIDELRDAAHRNEPVDTCDISKRYNVTEGYLRAIGSRNGFRVRTKRTQEDIVRSISTADTTIAELCAATGIRRDHMRRILSHARQSGKPIPYVQRDNAVRRLVDAFPPHVRAWFLAQMPPGTSRAEFITAIIVDAYNEEHDE